MKTFVTLLLISLYLLSSCKQEVDYAKAEEYIRESERQWAESVASGDTNIIKRIIAEDFVGVSPEGEQYGKAAMIKETGTAPQRFLSNHLNDIKIRFYGNFAIAQGDETWVKRAGSSTARFVWTDTWIFRDNKWEILAAEDLIAPVRPK